MSGFRPKQHGCMGMFHLEEAVLDVLLEAKHKDECLGAAEISKQAGIFRDRGTQKMMNDAITTGLLIKLDSEGRVERCRQPSGRGGWKLTADEFAVRRDDLPHG